MKRFNAFTLAEVLITLGIIGVVAAMTMPTLMANHQKKVLAVRAKKAYSLIGQAIKHYEAQEETIGDVSGLFDTGKSSEEVAQAFSKFFSAPKICLAYSGNCPTYSIKYSKPVYKKDEDKNDGSVVNIADGMRYPYFVLKDGTFISIRQYNSCIRKINASDSVDPDTGEIIPGDNEYTENFCASIYLDTNGRDLPNQYGADVFELRVQADGRFAGWDYTGWASLKNILQGGDPLYNPYKTGSTK